MKVGNAEAFRWYRANVHSDFAQFRRHLCRMQALAKSGRFRELAAETRESMRRMLALLYRRLSELERRAVASFAGLLLALGLAISPLGAETLTFVEQTGAANPFGGDAIGVSRASICFADVDEDGDQDAVVGILVATGDRSVLLYRKSAGSFGEPVQLLDPDADVSAGMLFPTPAWMDVDGDGDLDLVLAGYYTPNGESSRSSLLLYEKNGGSFSPVSRSSNPFYAGIGYIGEAGPLTPAFGDIDADGDFDLFLGGSIGLDPFVRFYHNTGPSSAPVFTRVETGFPLSDATFDYWPSPALVDIDSDGDLDAVVGDGYTRFGYNTAKMRFFENTGTAGSPAFVERTGTDNPLAGYSAQDLTLYVAPTFTDYDEDGDMDLFVGCTLYVEDPLGYQGHIQLYKNATSVEVGAEAQSATNASGQTVLAQSNKSAGAVYIVLEGEAHGTVTELDAAVSAHKGAKATVTAAKTNTSISTGRLVGGVYHALAVSGGSAPEVSALGASAITITAVEDPYPEAAGGHSSSAWIRKVTIGTIANQSGDDGGYGDYTAQAASLSRGTQVSIELAPGFKEGSRYYIRRMSQQVWKVWVDWNQDGDFRDSGEEAYTGGPSPRTVSATITVPADALVGGTRIRVAMRYYGSGAPVAEGTFDYGEVEDYTGTVE